MNIHDKPQNLAPQSVTSGPLPGSRKVYHHPGGRADIAVPLREIALDPSPMSRRCASMTPPGPIPKPIVAIDLSAGLPRLREPWLAARAGLDFYAGRAVRPEDNGAVAPDRLVPPCPANTLAAQGPRRRARHAI